MPPFFQSDDLLSNLHEYLRSILQASPIPTPKIAAAIAEQLSPEQINFSKTQAAKTIQHAWRLNKINAKLMLDRYSAYLSTVDEGDPQALTSSVMFGRTAADLNPRSKNKIHNPYVHVKAFYHRNDDLSGVLLNYLMCEYKITPALMATNEYIPITLLRNTPIEEIAVAYFSTITPALPIIKRQDYSIAFLELSRTHKDIKNIKEIISACGLIASPWEIAKNIKNEQYKTPKSVEIRLENFPDSQELLLQSKMFGKLNAIASSERHATNKLATNLQKLLLNLPELDSKAIQRIALMLDLCGTFYEQRYSRFAFCVYAIVHEISLALLKQTDSASLEQGFADFIAESEQTLLSCLGLNAVQLGTSQLVAFPAMSGTNAYVIAMRLAMQMKTKTGQVPTIRLFEPNYYEFDAITQAQLTGSNADIFLISAGPIVRIGGVVPGIDINLLVKQEIIDNKYNKPVTIVVDATTALYANLKLSPEVKALVEKGMLSILIHESHQKFGLLHTDQAQYGRTFGVCSKTTYTSECLKEMSENARGDFNDHPDMRIGAFISSRCGPTLEAIKKQHFSNGALLKNLFMASALISDEFEGHPYMLVNPDELYFLASDKEAHKVMRPFVESRDSFGHFCTTRATVGELYRLSPDASDTIDCAILASQIYLAQYFKADKLMALAVSNVYKKDSLAIEEQIIALALLNNVTTMINVHDFIDKNKDMAVFSAMHRLIEQCDLLINRHYYTNITNYLLKFRDALIDKYKPVNNHDFLAAIRILFQQEIKLMTVWVNCLKSDNKLCNLIRKLKPISINKSFLISLLNNINYVEQIALYLENMPEMLFVIQLFQQGNHTLTAKILAQILSDKLSQEAFLILKKHHIDIDAIFALKLMRSPEVAHFILEKDEALIKNQLLVACALNDVDINISEHLPALSHEKFCEGVMKIHDLNKDMLAHLRTFPEKYLAVKAHAKEYLATCYQALIHFFMQSSPEKADIKELATALDSAKDRYVNNILKHDGSNSSSKMKLLLIVASNVFASFTFGLAHGLNYLRNGRLFFFTANSTGERLKSILGAADPNYPELSNSNRDFY